MKKIVSYKGLVHKSVYGKWCLYIYYKAGDIDIMPISKKVYNSLLNMGYPVEG